MRRIGFISLSVALFSLVGVSQAQTYDTILKWPYLHYYNWPGIFDYSDSVQCSIFEYGCYYGRNYDQWILENLRGYAVYQHTDIPLKVTGIAFNDCGYGTIVELSLYDSAMNVIARDTTRAMPTNWSVIFTDTVTYKFLKVPRLDHSGIDEHNGLLPNEEIFLKMKRFLTKNTIELTGDFWIGISHYLPFYQDIDVDVTTFFWENHEPPYHINNVRYKVLEGETWLEDTMSGAIPELFVIVEPNCPNVTGLTGTMDSLGNVDIYWDSLDDQTKWVVHFTGPGVMETDTVTSCHKHYSGLYPNEAYAVKVNAQCYQSKYDIWSGWGETIWIGNTTGGIDEAAAFDFTLKPNPAADRVTVGCGMGINHLTVFNAAGVQVHTEAVGGSTSATIDTKGWPTGQYVVKVETAAGSASKLLTVAR